MSYDVSALGTYTQTNEKTLLVKSILMPRTIQGIKAKGNVMTGVKTKSQLPNMETDAVFQDGTGCGFTASGTTKISKRDVEVGCIKVNEALCPADLEASFEQKNLTAGSDYTMIIFATEYTDMKVAKIGKALEVAVWKGDKSSSNVQLKRFDGFIKIIDAATGVINGNTGGITVATGITKTNIAAILDGIYEAIPEDLDDKDDMVIFCGSDTFKKYIFAMRDKNYFKDFNVDGEKDEVTVIGTTLVLRKTPGLNGTNRLFCTHWGNMYFATDLVNEEEQFDLAWAPEAEQVRFKAKWKSGVQIAFPEEVIQFTLVP